MVKTRVWVKVRASYCEDWVRMQGRFCELSGRVPQRLMRRRVPLTATLLARATAPESVSHVPAEASWLNSCACKITKHSEMEMEMEEDKHSVVSLRQTQDSTAPPSPVKSPRNFGQTGSPGNFGGDNLGKPRTITTAQGESEEK